MTYTLHVGDALEVLRTMPAESVHCCVTSPPYWGLRDYGCDGQIGLEATPDEYMARLVDVFREVRRVLRKDGTLWLNIGDSYAGSGKGPSNAPADDGSFQRSYRNLSTVDGAPTRYVAPSNGLKRKDLVGIPWMLAFALRADGWWLRADIVWSKPNPMPESVRDRPTRSHEYVFLLTKSERYYYDHEAIKEPAVGAVSGNGFERPERLRGETHTSGRWEGSTTRNRRTVWDITPQAFDGAHFAVMPEDLAELCILAGTSEHGACSVCGAPWERVIEKTATGRTRRRADSGSGAAHRRESHGLGEVGGTFQEGVQTRTVAWRPTCTGHRGGEPVRPCVVLDPFFGAGTVGLVAHRLDRNSVGIELSEAYADIARVRLDPVVAQGRLFVALEGLR